MNWQKMIKLQPFLISQLANDQNPKIKLRESVDSLNLSKLTTFPLNLGDNQLKTLNQVNQKKMINSDKSDLQNETAKRLLFQKDEEQNKERIKKQKENDKGSEYGEEQGRISQMRNKIQSYKFRIAYLEHEMSQRSKNQSLIQNREIQRLEKNISNLSIKIDQQKIQIAQKDKLILSLLKK